MAELPVKNVLRKIKIAGVVYAEHLKTNAGQVIETADLKVMTAAERTKLAGIEAEANKYSLPTATASVLGGVKIGTNIDITNGVISVKTADASNLGIVKIGTNINVSAGTISVATANGSTLGLAKAGTNVSVTNGEINVADANGATKGVVRITDSYLDIYSDMALSQKGANNLYKLIQNLQSPIDFVKSITIEIDNTFTSVIDVTEWLNSMDGPFAGYFANFPLRPGHAILINNTAPANTAFKYVPVEYIGNPEAPYYESISTKGYWLWIYDGSYWIPSIDFPELPSADYTGANESAMVEGLITKSMLWKLKGIADGATKVEASGTAGYIKVNGADVKVFTRDNLPIVQTYADGSATSITSEAAVLQAYNDAVAYAAGELDKKQSKIVFTSDSAVVPANDGDIVIYYV